eukprot:Em0013g958a
MLGELLLRHSDNLSKTLQSRHMSAAEGQKVAAMTVKKLKSLRTDESFQAFWELVQKTANELEVECPSLPRKRRAPRRYDSIGNEDAFPHQVEDYYSLKALTELLMELK